ncbi:amidohydrolase family protein [Constantimarinum furrinae]|uniref:Amidohydrolase-related domain-containing protein n=1 Tax=Constantimarinum furrinae TaxID=2562285 RepID=A0A7G8PUX1_9FLAO|nr:amidohydrolase family protein [Constantimarinum furrinae]QNJ98137.1 hypothetical protein ALE3EI_1580 [Constantimarinum furrinae]
MKKTKFYLFIVLCLNFLHETNSQSVSNDLIILRNVTIIDGRNNFMPNMDILIKGSKISSLRKSENHSYADSIQVYNLSGKFVIPGLIDSHVHLGQLGIHESSDRTHQEFRKWLYNGVTSVREMSGDARLIAYENRLIAIGKIPGPDIYYSVNYGSPDMVKKDLRQKKQSLGTTNEKVSWFQEAYPGMDIIRSIARAKGTGATGIKIYAGVDAKVIAQLSEEAHKQGLKSWSHLTVFPDRPLDVVKANVDVVSHVWGAIWQDPDVDPSLKVPFTHTSFQEARNAIFPQDLSLLNADDPQVALLYEEMIKRQTIWDATYNIKSSEKRNLYKKFLVEASKMGVSFSTGTDIHNDPESPFPSLFDEIEALVNDGILSEAKVIEAATFHGALAIGIESTHGSIEEGKTANLVVLSKNPLENIENIRSVVTVFKNGKEYKKSE